MTNEFFNNHIKRRLKNKERVSAAWIHSGSHITASIIANAGFDVAVIDMEHSPVEMTQLIPMIHAMKGTNCVPFVRAPWNDMVAIKRILDCGVYGVHIPFVRSKEEAENAVRYCKYPPEGVRGAAGCTNAAQYGYYRAEYFEKANDEGIVMVAIEDLNGAKAVDDMIDIDGIDGIFIGPSDLGASMGYLNKYSEEVQKVIREIEDKVVKSDKFLGTIANSVADAEKLYERGYNFVIMMSDLTALADIAKKTVTDFKETCSV